MSSLGLDVAYFSAAVNNELTEKDETTICRGTSNGAMHIHAPAKIAGQRTALTLSRQPIFGFFFVHGKSFITFACVPCATLWTKESPRFLCELPIPKIQALAIVVGIIA